MASRSETKMYHSFDGQIWQHMRHRIYYRYNVCLVCTARRLERARRNRLHCNQCEIEYIDVRSVIGCCACARSMLTISIACISCLKPACTIGLLYMSATTDWAMGTSVRCRTVFYLPELNDNKIFAIK